MARDLNTIAREIRASWTSVSPYADPYLSVMMTLRTLDDTYGADSARSIVTYFLANAGAWRGPTARIIKSELNHMLKS